MSAFEGKKGVQVPYCWKLRDGPFFQNSQTSTADQLQRCCFSFVHSFSEWKSCDKLLRAVRPQPAKYAEHLYI